MNIIEILETHKSCKSCRNLQLSTRADMVKISCAAECFTIEHSLASAYLVEVPFVSGFCGDFVPNMVVFEE